MKTSNKKKIVVSTLALAMGAALAGSISGSVAWYQYSTRATAAFTGTSAGTSRNLQIAKELDAPTATNNLDDTHWGWDINLGEHNLQPVSPVMNASGFPSEFKGDAVRQYAELNDASATDYISFDLYFQSIDETGAREEVDVYLETFRVNYTGGKKLDEALRVAITDGTTVWLASKDAHAGANATVTEGQLDLNDDGVNDRWIFEADDHAGLVDDGGTLKKVVKEHLAAGATIAADTYYTTYSDYTLSGLVPAGTVPAGDGVDYYKIGAVPGENKEEAGHEGDYIIYYSGDTTGKYESIDWDTMVSTFSTAYDVTPSTGGFVFSTLETTAAHLQVMIWLDGFAKIDGENVWDNALIGQDFSVQMRFQTVAEE